MWIKDIRNYNIEVYKDGELIYDGEVNEAPEEIKKYECKNSKLEHKKIIIEV